MRSVDKLALLVGLSMRHLAGMWLVRVGSVLALNYLGRISIIHKIFFVRIKSKSKELVDY
jgi:hypothetical protein